MPVDVRCIICHDPVRVPVKLVAGFSCETKRGRGRKYKPCNSVVRACVTCARAYFQLHLPPHQRDTKKKCVFCPATINLQTLHNADMCYEKDDMLMSIDDRKDYPCLHNVSGCSFKGSQCGIDDHLQNECNFRKMWCSCGVLYIAGEAQTHYESCTHHTRCIMGGCTTYVRHELMSDHLKHEHGVIQCCHMDCQELLLVADYEDHIQRTCLSRRVTCEDCNKSIRATCYKNHLLQHVNEENDRIQLALTRIERFTGLFRQTC